MARRVTSRPPAAGREAAPVPRSGGLLRLVRSQGMFATALLGQILSSGGNFATNVLLANALGPRLFGLWAYGWIVLTVLVALHNAAVQTPAQVLSRDAAGELDRPFLGAASLLGAVYAGGGGVLVALAAAAAAAIGGFPLAWALGFAPLAFGWMLVEYNRRIVLVIGRYRLANGLEAARALGGIAVVLALRGRLAGEAMLVASVWAIAGVVVLVGLLGTAALLRALPEWRGAVAAAARRCWTYGRWLLPTALSSRLGPDLSLAVAGAMLGPAAVGGYRAMLQIASGFNLIYQTLGVVLPARFVEMHRRGGDPAIRRATRALVALILLLGAATLIALRYLGEPLVRWLLGAQYAPYAPLLYPLTVMYVLVLIHTPLSAWLHALGQGRRLLLPNLAGVALALLAVVPLIGVLHVAGVAVALVCMYAAEVSGLALTLRSALARGRRPAPAVDPKR